MKIKAGDKIVNLSVPWSGKVRSKSKSLALVDLPNGEALAVGLSSIEYNYDLKVWEVIDEG